MVEKPVYLSAAIIYFYYFVHHVLVWVSLVWIFFCKCPLYETNNQIDMLMSKSLENLYLYIAHLRWVKTLKKGYKEKKKILPNQNFNHKPNSPKQRVVLINIISIYLCFVSNKSYNY